MSDLYWDRISAGLYETQFFVNGYKYRVTGEGIEWEAFYMFRTKDPRKREWRQLRYGRADRLKQAKVLCSLHNQNPRRKFVVGDRDTKRKYVSSTSEFKEVERIGFKEVLNVGGIEKTRDYGGYFYDLPAFYESYSSEVTYLGEEYFNQIIDLPKEVVNDGSEVVAVANRIA